jgi:hypothetical protein
MAVAEQSISIKGRVTKVPGVQVSGRTVVVTGKWLRMAAVKDELLVEGEVITDPAPFVEQIKKSGLRAEIFSFAQKLPDVTARHGYYTEWDNAAVVPITNYENWLKNRVEYDVRKAVRKAKRLEVVVKPAEFDDGFVRGIVGIYNDNPVRQKKPFWHYQKEFEAVKRENSTYLERSEFIGAYYHDELIGFIKMVYVDSIAMTLQVISKTSHYDKKSTNALLAKAVEICEQKGVTHLVYGKFEYDGANSSLTEFKRRNGFEKVLFPRYFIPLTSIGKVALKLRLHHGIKGMFPESLRRFLLGARAGFYEAISRCTKTKS